MKLRVFSKPVLGIATELAYTIALMAAAFLVCLILSLKI